MLVALLVDADGGSGSSFAPLALLPVVWLALYGTRAGGDQVVQAPTG